MLKIGDRVFIYGYLRGLEYENQQKGTIVYSQWTQTLAIRFDKFPYKKTSDCHTVNFKQFSVSLILNNNDIFKGML